MLLHILARGKIGRSAEAELVERYLRRIAPASGGPSASGWSVRVTELPEIGGRIPEAITPARNLLLDETGDQIGSAALAQQLSQWRDDGVREARFVIGPADGFSDAQRADADRLIAFGRATWPHLMVRAMLAEQLWRATSIVAGHPYHREG